MTEAPAELGESTTAPSQDDRSAIFPNDQGTLPLDARRVLVHLLRGPVLDGHRETKLWPLLLTNEAVLRSRLHDIFLDLVVDYDQKVAFTRQVIDEEVDAPILLRRTTMTFLESALVIFLRQKLIAAEGQGERAVVSKAEMLEHLAVYERERNADHARFERQGQNAIEKTRNLGVLHKIRGSEERFEVSPILKLLFPAEEILALTNTYHAFASKGFEEDSTGGNAGDGAKRSDEGDEEIDNAD